MTHHSKRGTNLYKNFRERGIKNSGGLISPQTKRAAFLIKDTANRRGWHHELVVAEMLRQMEEVGRVVEIKKETKSDFKGWDLRVFLKITPFCQIPLQIKSSQRPVEKFFAVHKNREKIPVLIFEQNAPPEAVHYAFRKIIKRILNGEKCIVETASANFIIKPAENS